MCSGHVLCLEYTYSSLAVLMDFYSPLTKLQGQSCYARLRGLDSTELTVVFVSTVPPWGTEWQKATWDRVVGSWKALGTQQQGCRFWRQTLHFWRCPRSTLAGSVRVTKISDSHGLYNYGDFNIFLDFCTLRCCYEVIVILFFLILPSTQRDVADLSSLFPRGWLSTSISWATSCAWLPGPWRGGRRASFIQQVPTEGLAAKCLLRKVEEPWMMARPEGEHP